MSTLIVAVLSFVGFLVAYYTYGRWIARKVFALDPDAVTPSEALDDGVDYVPTRKSVVFGHHFTSIAGTGPIVGPALAVFWGWLPALLWVVFGSILIGAVHDFGSLVISMRNRGQTVGEIAGRLISPRAKLLFLLILFFALTVVLAIFGLVIAGIFRDYPESVLSVWIAMPIAVGVGIWVHKMKGNLLIPSIGALILLYGAIYVGVYYLPIGIADGAIHVGANYLPIGIETDANSFLNPTVVWTVILMVYCFAASVLPVWLLLQPRDYVNSFQLYVALAAMMVGIAVAGLFGGAEIIGTAPLVAIEGNLLSGGQTALLPFLFITIACGACSGFHCLVSSGTSSKQIAREPDAQPIGYGSMLMEGALAVIVILACCAGIGMGVTGADGAKLVGHEAWASQYGDGSAMIAPSKATGVFIKGGANFLTAIGIDGRFAIGIVATLVACFAATTLDSATRLQRYVIHEIGETVGLKPLGNKYVATAIAVGLALSIALMRGPNAADGTLAAYGTGGLLLWGLFGATNQLLAGLAFMVVAFYLWRRNKPIVFVAAPMALMLVIPAWALAVQLFDPETGFLAKGNYLLFGFGICITALQIWMIVEGLLVFPKARGVLEPQLPPLPQPKRAAAATAGGSV
ncbi:MAG TPA: carbon starvation protein A [Pirellulaceae bacterium]|jgi:carbon starvation protein|nr:carbon starvation protein A [Pirellulaceae bacterium]